MNKILSRKHASIWTRVARRTRESEKRLLGRRIGIESEFFVRHPQDADSDSLVDFSQLLTRLRERLPLAPSHNNPFRYFLANGSSVSLEVGGSADLRTSLFEIATPECTSPRDVLLYELANERLLEDAFSDDHAQSSWALIKANTDANGHTLGQHESYDMQIAKNGWLVLWWIGLVTIFPAIVIYRLMASVWMGWMYVLCGLTQGMYQGLARRLPRVFGLSLASATAPVTPSESSHMQGGHARCSPGLKEPFLTAMWMHVAASGLRWLHWPIATAFETLIRVVLLRPQRRRLAAFLASRCIVDGAGYVDDQSRFWISQRSAMVNSLIGFGSYGSRRPLFRCDPLLRDLLSGPFWSFARFRRLFRSKQRIELAIGDSGMCQQSQYLRYGTTSLILDMVEFGTVLDWPRLRNIVDAIGQFSRDWLLTRSFPDQRGIQQTALDLQRWYARQLKQYLEKRGEVPHEAWEILEAWQTTLNQMVVKPGGKAGIPMTLVGRIDWLSKLWLVQQMEPGTIWQVRKKIDIRYHELSETGYHRKLTELVQIAPVIRDEEIQRAQRSPPSDSPARRRGNLIREFADSTSDLKVDWRSASYHLEGNRYRIEF